MKENTKRNLINTSSLVATTVAGVAGVVIGVPVIQVVAYLPPIVQTVFWKKIGLASDVEKELKEDLSQLIISACNTTKSQLQQKSSSMANLFEYSCARIESELMKDFSIENMDVYFHKCIEQECRWERIHLTEKDLHEILEVFVNIYVANLLKHPKLANYLSTSAIINHEERIRNLETEKKNESYKFSEDFTCYDDTNNYRDKFEEALFLHKNLKPQNVISLKDIFTMPSCTLRKNQDGFILNEDFDKCSLAVKKFIGYQEQEPGFDSGNILFIEGQAAMGKSSFISWLAWQHYFQTDISKEIFGNKNLRVIKLRDILLENSQLDLQTPFSNIFTYILGKDNYQYLNSRHTDIWNMLLKDTVLVLDGFDELCMVESIWGSGKETYFLNMNRQLKKADCGCKIIVTTRPNYLKVERLNFQKWYLQINPFLLKKRKEWTKRYEAKEKLSLELKTALLSNQDKTMECLLETPLVLYMIAAKKIPIYETRNIWELYNRIFSQEIYNRNYDKEGAHSIQKYQHNLYALTAEIAYAVSNEQHFFINVEKLLEIERVKDLAQKLDILEEDENINYEKLHTVLADCIGIASYFKVSPKRDQSGKYKNAIEFYHNNIKDYFCCEYIWMNLQRIYNDIPSNIFQMESWFISKYQNMFQFSVFMKDDNKEPSMVLQFFKNKLLYYKEKSIRENFISQELGNCYFKHFFGKMLQTGMICEYTYSGTKNILNMMVNIYACVFSIYHSLYVTYLKENELVAFTEEEYVSDISSSFIFRMLFLMGNVHNQSHIKFDGIMLSGIEFEKHDFSFSSFKDCLLLDCNFKNCDLRGADFSYAHLQGADLRTAIIDNSTCFRNAEFKQTLISQSQLSYVGYQQEGALLIEP